ncbi:MAG: FAD-dependent oxidoreductase, partial [Planctomycetota bacterium]
NYVEASRIIMENGRFTGLELRNTINGEEKRIHGKVLVNATGPFINSFLSEQGLLEKPFLRPTKGVHIILPHEAFPVSHAITFSSAVDGRVMFILPWHGYTLIGTTDTAGNPEEDKEATPKDIEYILNSIQGISNTYHPEKSQIINAYAGWRPLVAEEKKESDISRTHRIWIHPGGIVSIGGGKLTTYRRMAYDCIQKILHHFPLSPKKNLRTDRIPLPGAEGLTLPIKVFEEVPFPFGNRQKILEKYLRKEEGEKRLDSQVALTKGEILFYLYEEMALTPSDILERRTSLALKRPDYGVSLLDPILEVMEKEMGWGKEERERQKKAYMRLVEEKQKWKKS